MTTGLLLVNNNRCPYDNALAETRQLFGKNKKLPSIHFLRRYSEYFV
jgi:hypothetical protein